MSYRPIWGRPHLVTDWGEEQEERETPWTALFYDLIIVAAVMAISDPFVESEREESGEEISSSLAFNPDLPEIDSMNVSDAILKFLSILMMWNYLSDIYARFEDESLTGHLMFFVHCYGMACSTAACVERLDDQYIGLGVGIMIARLGLIIMHIRPTIYIPRARVHCTIRILQQLVVILALAIALLIGISAGVFRRLLAAIIVWDFMSIPIMVLAKDHRLPIHVATTNDRVQDGILVVFGEAILMLALKSREVKGLRSQYYYTALALSMWLVYSLALHAYHIFPTVEHHALRRSVLAGATWIFTSFAFQVFLLGAAIGLKRIHVLVGAGEHMVDSATKQILVCGVTGVLFCVILMRFCHYRMGRHPSKYDPPLVKAIKYFWWIVMVILGGSPFVLFATAMNEHSSPIVCLSSLSILMGAIVLLEAALSNGVVYMCNQFSPAAEKRGDCIIRSFTSASNNYLSITNEAECEQQRLV